MNNILRSRGLLLRELIFEVSFINGKDEKIRREYVTYSGSKRYLTHRSSLIFFCLHSLASLIDLIGSRLRAMASLPIRQL